MNLINVTKIKAHSQKQWLSQTSLIIHLAILICILTSIPASAQGPAIPFKPKIYIGGGYAPIISPDSSFKNIYNPSFSFQAAVSVPLSPGLEIVGKFQYHNFNIQFDGIPEFSPVPPSVLNSLGLTDPGRTITMLGVDAKLPFGPTLSPIRPYFLIGGGSFTVKQNAVNQTITFGNPAQTLRFGTPRLNETDIYFNIGFGADIKIGPTLGLFIEGKYTILNTPVESSALTPIIVGLRLF